MSKIHVVAKARPEIVRIKLPPPPRRDEWVSVREAARRADLSHFTVWSWAKRAIIPSRRASNMLLVPAGRVEQLASIYREYGRAGRWVFRRGDPNHAYIPVTRA